jgi:hypothetical protein
MTAIWLSALALGTAASITGCGGTGLPGNVAVQVGGAPITTTSVAHWTAVVKALESTDHLSSQQRATGFLISASWTIVQARELGLALTPRELAAQVRQFKARQAGSAAEFDEFLSRTGETSADLVLQATVAGLSSRLPGVVEQRYGVPSDSEVARYYAAHLARFFVPERRDIRIVHTPTASSAGQAKREIERGKSFAALAKQQSVAQPIDTHNGLLIGLVPNFFSEKPINNAIFAAYLGVLTGPVRISLGYYVFEVVHIHRSYRRPLAEVRDSIRVHLGPSRRLQAWHEFERRMRKLWTARTKCNKGYVVANCRGSSS